MRKEIGITMVALVITIIILIILAGISINMLLGENGIITKAQKAKENLVVAQQQEEQSLNYLYEQIKVEGPLASDEIIVQLQEQLKQKEQEIENLKGENISLQEQIKNQKNLTIIENIETTKLDNPVNGIQYIYLNIADRVSYYQELAKEDMIAVPIYVKLGGSYYYGDWVNFFGISDYDATTGLLTFKVGHNNGMWYVGSDAANALKDNFKINLLIFK